MAFSSIGYAGNTVMGVPEWLHATPGATTDYYYEGKKYVVPNWNADAYLTPLEHLIAALGARYNHDERVEWFEFSGYGDFSENHIWFIADIAQGQAECLQFHNLARSHPVGVHACICDPTR
jgi:hypothetical protein